MHKVTLPASGVAVVQPQLVVRIPARMLDPATHVLAKPRHFIAGHIESLRRGRCNNGSLFSLDSSFESRDFRNELRGYRLVCVNAENPVIAGLPGREVFLGRIARPVLYDYPVGESAGYLDCAITTARVDDDDLVGP